MIIPKNSKDIAGLRAFLTSVKDQNCSLMSKYAEPIKQLAESLNTQLQAVLAALPTDDAKNCEWCTEDVLIQLFNSLNCSNAICAQLGLELSKIGAATGTTTAAEVDAEVQRRIAAGELFPKTNFDTAVAAAVEARATSGELVPKTMVEQLCADARTKGVSEGRTQLQGELDAAAAAEKLVTTRREGITTAGLPLPPAEAEALFRETDENFTAAQARFTAREEALKKEGITLASDDLRANLWLDDKAFGTFERTVKSIPSLRGTPEPLATPPGAPSGNTPSRMIA